MAPFEDIFPTFLEKCAELHELLRVVAFMLFIVGTILFVLHGFSPKTIMLQLVRLLILTALLVLLPEWGNRGQELLQGSILSGLGIDPANVQDQYNALLVVKRDEHLPGRVQSLGDFKAQVARHERLVLLEEEIEGLRPVDAADLVHVPEPLGRDQSGSGAAALDDGVDHHRRAMDQNGRALDVGSRISDGGQDSFDHRPGLRGRLPEGERARRLIQDCHVCEGSPDIDGDAQGAEAGLIFHRNGRWRGRHSSSSLSRSLTHNDVSS
jgi:hypothetical protein